MGLVLKARDISLDIEVAIKVLVDSRFSSSASHLQRFQREAQAAGALGHENIVRVYDFGITEKNIPYLVMEFVEGEQLDKFIKKNKTLDWFETVSIVRQIAKGMAHAHSKSVVHRDLKPANILITNQGTKDPLIKIVDFGIAKASTTIEELQFITQTGEILGTPAYMSPEQIKGEEVEKQSDVYSLGCIFFECLAGRAPFRGSTTLETFELHLSKKTPDLTDYNSSIPDKLVKLVERMLEKSKEKRVKTMDEVVERLDEIVHSYNETIVGTESEVKEQPSELHSVTAQFAPEKNQGSEFKLIAVIFVLLLVLATGYGYYTFTMESESASTKTSTEYEKKAYDDIYHMDGSFVSLILKHPERRELFYVDNPAMNDSVIKAVAPKLKLLQRVFLSHTSVTDKSLFHLSQHNLRYLVLVDDNITDKGLSYIGSIKSLRILDLSKCPISDTGLKKLYSLPGLRALYLEGCKNITRDGIARLKEALPGCTVYENKEYSRSAEDRDFEID